MKVHERIKFYINAEGLKQKVIAQKAGYSEKQFSAMMRGIRKINADDYEKICVALNCEPNDFMGEQKTEGM